MTVHKILSWLLLIILGLGAILIVEMMWLVIRDQRGATGLTGLTGLTGEPGMGIDGLKGGRGLTGDVGPRGYPGATGSAGFFQDFVISQTTQTQGGVALVIVPARSESSVIQLGVIQVDAQQGTTHLGAGRGPACAFGYRVLTYDFQPLVYGLRTLEPGESLCLRTGYATSVRVSGTYTWK